MNDVTIILNADGTFSVDGKSKTLREVINLARDRRDCANAEKKAARNRVKLAKAGQRKAKLLARKAKLEAELKKLDKAA